MMQSIKHDGFTKTSPGGRPGSGHVSENGNSQVYGIGGLGDLEGVGKALR